MSMSSSMMSFSSAGTTATPTTTTSIGKSNYSSTTSGGKSSTTKFTSRRDSLGDCGSQGHPDDAALDDHKSHHVPSLTYQVDESDVWRAWQALEHYHHRGQFWNASKHTTTVLYLLIALTGMFQGCVAYCTNLSSMYFIERKFQAAHESLEQGWIVWAGLEFVVTQMCFAAAASACVAWVPVSAGSGIPEVKVFLNGIDLPNIGDVRTLIAKVVGVVCSVSAGLPVGKEGPMVHSGAVVATTLASGQTRNDKAVRDLVACGAAAGVCTAFSAPIGGILFALEEGASYWGPSLTWRTFFCSMIAFTTLLMLNTLGSVFGKVGFNKLFSFGNFIYEHGGLSSFAVYELALFVAIGAIGGLVGAVFNHTNQTITKWRMKHVNHSKFKRFAEVIILSFIVSMVMFALPLAWRKCTPIPRIALTDQEEDLFEQLVPFTCPDGYYNELASLYFTEPGVAIRQLFHLHTHAFSEGALMLFFFPYITMAVVVYGIAVPSGLFVPSLLSGAALGRLLGNLALRIYPKLAFSNTYALMGAAAVLGGMARMTISLTVILLECTGNEQYVLPLMLTLMTARIVGQLFNQDLYHIHIHFKKGVYFLESELKSISRHHDLIARQIMSDQVVFFRPVEKVSRIVDTLLSCEHSFFPLVDPDDNGVFFGTIGRNELCVLLQQRAFGHPVASTTAATTTAENNKGGNNNNSSSSRSSSDTKHFHNNYVHYNGETYFPLVQWDVLEKAYPKYPKVRDIRLHSSDRDCFMDLRPYANTSPITIQEKATVGRTYELFRTLGMRFLPVVNRHNQVVGTITRADLSPESLAHTMLVKGKKNR